MKSFMACLMTVLVVGALGQSAFADRTIVCSARGNSFSVNGSGTLEATASLRFTEAYNRNNQRVLRNIIGDVRVDSLGGRPYVGRFAISSLTENSNYRPRRYVGYSQFKQFDAMDTHDSAEDGMWGSLVLENLSTGRNLQAHYILQAGDHLGGTLHMSCAVQ